MDDDRFAEMMKLQTRSLEIQSNALEEQIAHMTKQEKRMVGLTVRLFASRLRTFLVEGIDAGQAVLDIESKKVAATLASIPDKAVRDAAVQTIGAMRWEEKAQGEIATVIMMAEALEPRPSDVYFLTQDDMRNLQSIRSGSFVRSVVPVINPALMHAESLPIGLGAFRGGGWPPPVS